MQICETFECSGQHFSNSSCQFGGISSSNFASIFIVMTHKLSLNFKLKPFLLWTKEPQQSSNFKTIDCSVNNLSVLYNPIFLQIFHHSSLSLKITAAQFFKLKRYMLFTKGTNQNRSFENSECLGQNLPNHYRFSNNKSVFLPILYHVPVS